MSKLDLDLSGVGGDKNPELIRFQFIEKLNDPTATDLMSEVSDDQRNIISIFRAYHEKMLIYDLDDKGDKIPLVYGGKPVLDSFGRQMYQAHGGLPGVMRLCDNWLRLNISLGRQGRKEFVRILEPKASNINANSFSSPQANQEQPRKKWLGII